jgi:hypothetical protein
LGCAEKQVPLLGPEAFAGGELAQQLHRALGQRRGGFAALKQHLCQAVDFADRAALLSVDSVVDLGKLDPSPS